MSGLAVGLLLGVGLFCVWWSCWAPDESAPPDPRPRRGGGLADALVQADLRTVTVSQLVTGSLLLGGLTFVLAWATIAVVPVAACFAALAALAPVTYVRSRARRRRLMLRDLWPDAVDNVASGVRAGLALPEALAQLAVRGPEPLRPAFARFADDYRVTGRFSDCLDRLKGELADPVGDRLVESLRIAREVGGSDLGRLLRTLSTFLREDARTRAEMESRQSWTVNAARLAVASPWVVLATMATRPASLQPYGTPLGALVLGSGALMSSLAYWAMTRIGRLPEEQRVLR
ncbi:type II secretion system F family protein [Arsenicicoccus sp. oral taxon 190]|uniref:type II secretion system F family protein n=1 Tax=Arsenicicoccus sp. oral taxon 190 TaxID=1658671 RepID=UPI000679ECE0|nr:type II secretion system F family protein [Arsenicicoccus sp. oral taxon 190]AKT51449.1 type II secretion system protein F [Arsenicicoccus sp. oral taxon 190]